MQAFNSCSEIIKITRLNVYTSSIYRRLEKHNDVINQYGSYHYSKWGNMGGVLSMAAENESGFD